MKTLIYPALIQMYADIKKMAVIAIEILIQKIEKGKWEKQHVILPEVMVRKSTRKVA